jgi:hypothetical protein
MLEKTRLHRRCQGQRRKVVCRYFRYSLPRHLSGLGGEELARARGWQRSCRLLQDPRHPNRPQGGGRSSSPLGLASSHQHDANIRIPRRASSSLCTSITNTWSLASWISIEVLLLATFSACQPCCACVVDRRQNFLRRRDELHLRFSASLEQPAALSLVHGFVCACSVRLDSTSLSNDIAQPLRGDCLDTSRSLTLVSEAANSTSRTTMVTR